VLQGTILKRGVVGTEILELIGVSDAGGVCSAIGGRNQQDENGVLIRT